MAQLPQARKPCTINHLALIMGLIGSVEIDETNRKLVDTELDKAVDAAKKSFHARNDRAALETQVAYATLQWGAL